MPFHSITRTAGGNEGRGANTWAKEHDDQFIKDTISTLSSVGVRKTKQVCSMKVPEIDFSGKHLAWEWVVWKLLRSVINSIWFFDGGCWKSSFLVVKQQQPKLSAMSLHTNLDDVWGCGCLLDGVIQGLTYSLFTDYWKLGQGCNAATLINLQSSLCGGNDYIRQTRFYRLKSMTTQFVLVSGCGNLIGTCLVSCTCSCTIYSVSLFAFRIIQKIKWIVCQCMRLVDSLTKAPLWKLTLCWIKWEMKRNQFILFQLIQSKNPP